MKVLTFVLNAPEVVNGKLVLYEDNCGYLLQLIERGRQHAGFVNTASTIPLEWAEIETFARSADELIRVRFNHGGEASEIGINRDWSTKGEGNVQLNDLVTI